MSKHTLPALILTVALSLSLFGGTCGAQGDDMARMEMDRSMPQFAVELASDTAAIPGGSWANQEGIDNDFLSVALAILTGVGFTDFEPSTVRARR